MTSTFTPAIAFDAATDRPVPQAERIQTIDILRGVALLGILIKNIWTFGLSREAIPQLNRGPHGGNYWIFSFIDCLFAGKMRALFSMLFGAGVILFPAKKQQPGQMSPIELFIRRQLWLMALGVVNAYVLIRQWDILFHYGYGMGYFGSLKIYQLYIVVAEIWLIQIVFSVVWLNYFRFGPFEWLWRSLTYGKRQPMALTGHLILIVLPLLNHTC